MSAKDIPISWMRRSMKNWKSFFFPFESSQKEFYTYLRGMKSKVIEDVNIVSVVGLSLCSSEEFLWVFPSA